jgi:TolB-like protein/Tfp pilus assembly protein PilF
MSGGQDGEYFSDGVSEELINVLAQVDSLRVAARTSSFAFKNTHLSIRSIADSLNVGAIVEGSVQRENNRLRITARLIDASTGYELWSERVETESSNVLAAQDSIVHSIADALRLKLSAPAQARIAARKPVNPEAYDLYSRGQYFLARRTLADFNRAISHFEQAVRVDSQYAVAYAGLADAYLLKGNYDAKGRELSRARQKAAALKAMQLDSMLPEAHRALCRVFDNEYDNVAAERECRRAIELNPADVMAHNWLHFPLGYLGRHEEAIREARIAQSLDPASVGVAEGLAQAYTTAGRYDEAIQQYRRVLELQPEQPSSRNDLATLYWAKGMFEQARALIEPPARAGNRLPQAILARIHMSSGDTAAARRILNELKNLPESELPDIVRPIMFIALNQPDEALETLERSVRERTLYRLRFYDVMLKELWQDPRFLQLKREAHVR